MLVNTNGSGVNRKQTWKVNLKLFLVIFFSVEAFHLYFLPMKSYFSNCLAKSLEINFFYLDITPIVSMVYSFLFHMHMFYIFI